MGFSFSTDAVSIAERVDLWHSISCSTYIAYDCKVADRSTFGARIDAAPLADLNLSVCNNTPLVADRTPRHVARSDTDSMFFGIILSGSKHIEQDGRATTAMAGDCYLVDAGRPYILTCDETKSELVLELPRQQLEARTGCSAPMRAKVVTGRAGPGELATSFLQHLRQRQRELSSTTASQLASQAVDLVALALTNGAPETVRRVSSAAAISRLRLHHAIDENVQRRRASCQEVAELAGISPRYANFLLAQEGTSLERLLMRKRLDQSRVLLADPLNRHRQISDIATSLGFDSASHFARSFKQTFGLTARDFRSEVLCRTDRLGATAEVWDGIGLN
jgi:AraC-like DNA-binding protein